LLKSCKRGRDVLASFQKNNFLEDGQQDLLVAVIIDEEQREDTMKRYLLFYGDFSGKLAARAYNFAPMAILSS